jgi:hypothetical protein
LPGSKPSVKLIFFSVGVEAFVQSLLIVFGALASAEKPKLRCTPGVMGFPKATRRK